MFWTNAPFTRGGKEAHHFHSQLQALKVMFKILPFNCEAILLVSTRKKGYQHFKQLNTSSHHSLRFPLGWFAIQSYNLITVSLQNSYKHDDVPLMYPKCYSTLTHNKLIVCCISVACMHSNTNVYSGAAFLFLGGCFCAANAPERNCQGLVD